MFYIWAACWTLSLLANWGATVIVCRKSSVKRLPAKAFQPEETSPRDFTKRLPAKRLQPEKTSSQTWKTQWTGQTLAARRHPQHPERIQSKEVGKYWILLKAVNEFNRSPKQKLVYNLKFDELSCWLFVLLKNLWTHQFGEPRAPCRVPPQMHAECIKIFRETERCTNYKAH